MLLKAKDFELWQDLDQKQLDPQFYTFRWITLLCSQEFELPGRLLPLTFCCRCPETLGLAVLRPSPIRIPPIFLRGHDCVRAD